MDIKTLTITLTEVMLKELYFKVNGRTSETHTQKTRIFLQSNWYRHLPTYLYAYATKKFKSCQ